MQHYITTYTSKMYFAMCPPGTTVTGGGFDVDPNKMTVHSSMPSIYGTTDPNGWEVYATSKVVPTVCRR